MELKSHQENRGNNGIYDKRNKINNLTGKEWVFSTRSVKTKDYKFIISKEMAFRDNYIDFMPIELIKELVLTFTKPKSIIVDPNCNFGLIGVLFSTQLRNNYFYGYNFRKTNLIDQFLPFRDNIKIYTNNNESNGPIINKTIPDLVFSELIFTSIFPEQREKEFKDWLNTIINYLESIIPLIEKNTYFIFCLQNTKFLHVENKHSRYVSNVLTLSNSFNRLDLVLKGEIIWKMSDTYINELKSVLANKIYPKQLNNSILNDKRILVYRKEI